MARPKGGTFYGWWIACASFVILFLTVGIGLYVPPVFLLPLQEQFGWSRAAITTGTGIAALVSTIMSPLAGLWIDKFGVRKVMVGGALVMGCAFALCSLIESLWHLYALNALIAAGLTCTAWVPNQTLISNWFEKRRGLAMGIALTGIGFGGLVMAPLAGQLITRLGWRAAFLTLAALLLVVVATAILAVVRTAPADLGLLPDGEAVDAAGRAQARNGAAEEYRESGMELSEAVRTSAFWLLSAAGFLSVLASFSVISHLVAFLGDMGFEPATAAGSLGLAVGASVGGRVAFGLLADHYSKRHIMTWALLLFAVGTLFLFEIRSTGALPAFVITFGLALGGTAVLSPLLVGEYFGLRAFAKILAFTMIASAMGAAVGPVLTGRIFDVTGSYHWAFTLHVGAFLTAALAIFLLPHPNTPEG